MTGWFDDDSLSVCVDLQGIVHLSHCQGSLRNGEYVDCQIDKGRLFKGDLKLYIKNDHELWLHLDGSVGFIHWNKDIHIKNLKQSNEVVIPSVVSVPSETSPSVVSGMPSETSPSVVSGMPSATSPSVVTAASSAYSNSPYSLLVSAIRAKASPVEAA